MRYRIKSYHNNNVITTIILPILCKYYDDVSARCWRRRGAEIPYTIIYCKNYDIVLVLIQHFMTIKIIIRMYEYIVITVIRDVCSVTAFREANTRQGATRDCLSGGSDHGGTERAYAVCRPCRPRIIYL